MTTNRDLVELLARRAEQEEEGSQRARALRRAALAGVRVSIGSDSHHPVDLAAAELGLGAVLAAGVPAGRVLNLMSVDELLTWRQGRRRAATAV